jgi:type II secretory pathway component PulJ
MSDRESDIEFDFFEESDTRESAEDRPRRRGPRPPARPPTGLTPLLRLVGLISFAILIVLLLILWVNGCREDQRKDTYRNYVERVEGFATRSGQLGRQFNRLLTTRGTEESVVENELSGLAEEQNQIAEQARQLEVPGRLRAQHAHMLDSFDLRFNGLMGMNDAFKSTASSRNANTAGRQLALQMKRLVASDVIWEDLVKEPTKEELANLGITGVNVPDSIFLPNADIATSTSMKAVWQRIHGGAPGGETCTPRGTGITSTKVLPSGRELSTSETNTIQTSTDLGFSVTIENSGCAQEVGLKVRLTIQQTQPITKQATVALLNSGDETTVEFRDISTPSFEQRTSVTVEVDPVPQERSVDNNTASYPVQFSVG